MTACHDAEIFPRKVCLACGMGLNSGGHDDILAYRRYSMTFS